MSCELFGLDTMEAKKVHHNVGVSYIVKFEVNTSVTRIRMYRLRCAS